MLRRVLVSTFALSLTLVALVGIVGQLRAQGGGAAKIDYTKIAPLDLVKNTPQKAGYSRQAIENVVAPMPPFGGAIKSADDLWKILTFVRSKYDGDPSYKYGDPPAKP
jgi:hypothetical protein